VPHAAEGPLAVWSSQLDMVWLTQYRCECSSGCDTGVPSSALCSHVSDR